MSSLENSPRSSLPFPLLLACAVFGIVVPALLAFNLPPSATFLNQAAAFVGWGLLLALLMLGLPQLRVPGRWPLGAVGASVALGVMLLCAFFAPITAHLPWTLALSAVGLLAAGLLTLWCAVALVRAGQARLAFDLASAGLLLAGLLSLVVVYIQVFLPAWMDGNIIAHALATRPGGNLRQANHLSSLLMLSACALVWWAERFQAQPDAEAPGWQAMWQAGVSVLMFGLMLGAALTASRTGGICALLLGLWGLLDRSLSRFARVLLLLSPLMFVGAWMGMSEWAAASGHVYGGDAQLHAADLSSSRLGIWKNTLSLIEQNPWAGVGWGEFNFAWTLTPFPGRPVAFFDHTHNLPLQLLVELGLPMGGGLVLLALWVLWRGAVSAVKVEAGPRTLVRCAFVMVLLMVTHSQVEYPLWYAYFLLPTLFALGLVLGSEPVAEGTPEWRKRGLPHARHALLAGAIGLVLVSFASVLDYLRVVAIFAPAAGAPSLYDRIESGQRSVFFGHHADYAAVTTAENPSEQMDGFRRATHYLLDARLMVAWSKGLAEIGEVDKARWVAQRLKEFRNPGADEFFEPCKAAESAGVASSKAQALPFQCTAPQKAYTFRDFR